MTVPDIGRLSPGEHACEEVEIGDFFETGGINVTEAHVVAFAGISGDHFDIHVDDEFARSDGFPGRVAHGLLGLAMAANHSGRRHAAARAARRAGRCLE